MANDPESFSPFSWRHWLRSIFQLSASPWRWMVGLEVGIASLLLLSLFTLSGHQPLGLIATLGSFTGLYGGALRRIDRMRLLPLVGLGFIVASVAGVLCAGSIGATVACLIVMTALACAIALGWGLGPPGAMQFVLVAGISGHMVAALRNEGGAAGILDPIAGGGRCSVFLSGGDGAAAVAGGARQRRQRQYAAPIVSAMAVQSGNAHHFPARDGLGNAGQCHQFAVGH